MVVVAILQCNSDLIVLRFKVMVVATSVALQQSNSISLLEVIQGLIFGSQRKTKNSLTLIISVENPLLSRDIAKLQYISEVSWFCEVKLGKIIVHLSKMVLEPIIARIVRLVSLIIRFLQDHPQISNPMLKCLALSVREYVGDSTSMRVRKQILSLTQRYKIDLYGEVYIHLHCIIWFYLQSTWVFEHTASHQGLNILSVRLEGNSIASDTRPNTLLGQVLNDSNTILRKRNLRLIQPYKIDL